MSAPSLSQPLSISPSDVGSNSTLAPPPSGRRWLREPLLHFVVLGGLLFGLDHFIVGRRGDNRTIVVGADVDREAIQMFKASRNRDPNTEELTALRRAWLDNEILYREGLALQVDRGDPAIRERVIFKALSVIDSNVKLPAIDESGLRNWFASHHDKYDEPGRFDFEEAALSGDNSEAAIRAFVKLLNSGVPGDAKAGLRVFKGRPQSNLVQSYGAAFAKTLASAKPGEWLALNTKDGWRAVRLNAISAPRPATFESVRDVVLQDWKDTTAAEQRTAAVRALGKKYVIKHEVAAEDSSE